MDRIFGCILRARTRPAFLRSVVAACLFFSALLLGCGDDDFGYYDQCRYEPGLCGGGLGALCGNNLDCGIGFCCREPKECGGGMCTLSCRGDLECPIDMACEHEKCFFTCNTDLDCARGQHCGHDHTVCEW